TRSNRRAPGGARFRTRRRQPRRGRSRSVPARARARGRCRRTRGRGFALIVAMPLALADIFSAPGRTLLRVLTLSAAVGRLGAMRRFVGPPVGGMTASAARAVPVDWQGPVASYRAATHVARHVARQAGIAEASPTATAPFAGIEHASRTLG